MSQAFSLRRVAALLTLALVLASPRVHAQAITAPQYAIDAATAHVRAHAATLGLAAADVSDLVASDGHVGSSGIAYVYLRQRLDGLDVTGSQLSIAVGRDGRIVHATGNLVANLTASAASRRSGGLSADAALRAAAAAVNVDLGAVTPAEALRLGQPRFDAEGLATPATAREVYFRAEDGTLARAWEVMVDGRRATDMWLVTIDAASGAELARQSLTIHEHDAVEAPVGAHATHRAAPSLAPVAYPSPFGAAPFADASGALVGSYRVYPVPVESPIHNSPLPPTDGRTTVANPDNAAASPFGWHDTNGIAGAEFTTTQGNNVHAYTDTDANNTPDAGSSPDGGAGLSFNFPLDLTQAPSTYRPAAVTNLFFWNNVIHDILHHHGFTTAAGNFQVNTYGAGGTGNDGVNAEAQDGSGTNNANFSTPADGSRPRMQMYVGTTPNPDVDGDFDNAVIVHEYGHGVSNRLTGGPSNVSCLGNSEQMGEGWSDYYGLMLTMRSTDTAAQARGIGTYLFGQAANGPGIRPSPYSTSFAVNDYTYQDSRTQAVPHGVGFVWATILWEATWDMIAAHGFNADLYNASGTAGNQMMLRLVTEAMKLQPCNPGFVDGRNAILAADAALYPDAANPGRGLHYATLWSAFARRGLGVSASQGSTSSNADNTEAFDVPLPAPAIAVSPTTINGAAAPGSSITVPVTVSNTAPSGHGPLNFTASIIGGMLAQEAPPAERQAPVVTRAEEPAIRVLPGAESAAKVEPAPTASARSQAPTSSSFGAGGPDAFGYAWQDSNEPGGPTYSWVDISTTGTSLTMSDDSFVNVALPFSFPFYGVAQSSVNIVSNGYLNFGTSSTAFTNTGIPNSAAPNNLVAPFWDDLNPSSVPGRVRYQDMGDGRFVVSWIGMPRYANSAEIMTFQVILYANGEIVYQYQTMTGTVTSATVGIEDGAGAVGLQVAFDQAYITNNLAVRFTTPTIWASVAPASGSVAAGASTNLTVTLDASELTAGVYNAVLRVSSNDPTTPTVDVPITFAVGAVSPTYTNVTATPTGTRTVVTAGYKAVVRWTGPGVPNASETVDVYLRNAAGALTLLGSGLNRGKLKVTVPAATPAGSDYAFVVSRQDDPSIFGATGDVVVSNEAELYTFAEPDAGESWARGSTHTVTWSAPPTAPAGGTVTLTLQRDNGTVIFSAAGEPDDGAFDYAIPAGLATGTGVYFTIVNEADAAYRGASPAFDIVRIEPTLPAEGSSWAVGSSQTVTWTTGAANNGGVVRLSLRGVSNGYSRALATNVPYGDGTRTVTVPSTGSVPPAGEYFVQLLYTYTPPGGVETRYVSNSNRFTVTNPLSPAVVARHFGSPVAGEGSPETVVSVRGLSEGAEVGAFATTGDDATVLLSSGVVEGGEAVLVVPSEVVVGADEWSFGSGTSVTLRSYEGGIESALEARTVTLGEGSVVSSVSLVAGTVVTADVSKGSGVGSSDAFSVSGVVPNPTSGGAVVRFTLSSSEAVTVTVYDMLGRTVATLFDGTASAGANAVSVPSSLNAGVYVVRVSTEGATASARFTVIR